MILLTDPLQKGNALNKKLTSMVSPKLNMILLTDPLQKGNALNNQFYLVFTPVSNISRTDFNKQCNMPASTQHPKISHLAIKTDGIQKLLCNLNPSKAAGPDKIKPKLLKELSVEIAPILTIIFNKSVQSQLVLFHQTGELPMSLLCTKKVKNITLKTIIQFH